MSFSPILKNPLTDLTGCVVNHQNHGKCAKFELRFMDCMEAYGMDLGKEKCKDLYEDFNECFTQKKQLERLWAMRTERHRQYYSGESKEHYVDPPKIDSY